MRIQQPNTQTNMDTEKYQSLTSPPPEGTITYTDDSLATSVLGGMYTLRQAGQLCDCVLRVGKKLAEYPAHQAVLASVSPYFMAMFEHDPRIESLTRKAYNIKETTPEAFETLLDYAYTGSLKVSRSTVKDIYLAANVLKFSGVVAACSEYLMDHLDTANCLEVRMLITNEANLVERVDQFIHDNMADMKEHKSFLALPQINLKLIGYSRGALGGPDSSAVAKLISDWLVTVNFEEGDTTRPASAEHATTKSSTSRWSALDMQVLSEHDNVLFLDADNHLQDVSEMDDSMLKTDVVQDYVKVCKKYSRLKPERSVSTNGRNHDNETVDVIAHDQIHSSLHSLLICINGAIYNVMVRMQFLPLADKYSSSESGLNRNSTASSSSASSAEEDEQVNGNGDVFYQSTLSSFEPLAEMAQPRCGVGVTAWDGKLIAFGGNDRGECLASVETYDPETNSWTFLSSMTSPRGRFECAAVAGKLYACGGSDGRRELDSVECFDGEKWVTCKKMTSPKSSAGVGTLANRLYVIGGYNGQRAEKTCEVYNPSTDSWSPIVPLTEGRSQCSVCSYKGLLYVFGGTDSWNCSSTVEIYDPATMRWKPGPSMPQARRGAATTVFKGKIYVAGGSNGSKCLDTVDILDVESNSWSSGTTLQTPRSNAGMTVLSGRLYIVGGYGKNRFLSDMEVLEGDDDSQWCSYRKSGLLKALSDSDLDH